MPAREQWKPTMFVDYEVSDLGRLRSWRTKNGRGVRPPEPTIIKPILTNGYIRWRPQATTISHIVVRRSWRHI